MKNLSKIVEKIIKIEPGLKTPLLSIKTKWENNSHKSIYWKQLLKILNTQITHKHPKRTDIENILNPKKKVIPKKIYTFEPPSSAESVVGTLPENLECKMRKHDRLQIIYSKDLVEARMTRNSAMMVDLNKKCELLEIDQKKLWFDIKNHFNLWEVSNPVSFFIRSQGPLLVLTALTLSPENPFFPGNSQDNEGPNPFLIKLDPELLKRFLKYFNNPPPGFTPPEND